MMDHSAMTQSGVRSLLAAVGAIGIEAATKVSTAVRDAVMVLTSLDGSVLLNRRSFSAKRRPAR
nr:hypothetical protein [Arthrobacter sp. CAL618]